VGAERRGQRINGEGVKEEKTRIDRQKIQGAVGHKIVDKEEIHGKRKVTSRTVCPGCAGGLGPVEGQHLTRGFTFVRAFVLAFVLAFKVVLALPFLLPTGGWYDLGWGVLKERGHIPQTSAIP